MSEERYDLQDWRYEVACGDTRLGFDEWVEHQAEMEGLMVVPISRSVLLSLMEPLRLAHVYALKDSHPEELGEDFKPEKWDGYEIAYAREASQAYQRLLDAMLEHQKRVAALGGRPSSSPRS